MDINDIKKEQEQELDNEHRAEQMHQWIEENYGWLMDDYLDQFYDPDEFEEYCREAYSQECD